MQELALLGASHSLVPHFLSAWLQHPDRRATVLLEPDELAQDGPASGLAHLERLHVAAAGGPVPSAAGRVWFLSVGDEEAPLPGVDALPPGPSRLLIVADLAVPGLAASPPAERIQALRRQLAGLLPQGEQPWHVMLLLDGIADLPRQPSPFEPAVTPLDDLVHAVRQPLLELERRLPGYFDRHPLSAPTAGQRPLRGLGTHSVARCLANAWSELPPGWYLLQGAPLFDTAALLGALTDRPLIPDGRGDPGAAGLVIEALQHRQAHWQLGMHAPPVLTEARSLSLAAEPPLDLRALLHPPSRQPDATLPFAAMSQARQCRAGQATVHYLRCGSGPQVLLIVNAFGLPLDFWSGLAQGLSRHFTLLALTDAPDSPVRLPMTSYASEQPVADYLAAIDAVLLQEQVTSCHVASWCSGAKLALELAAAWPARVRSLALLAPSFAGMSDHAGADSTYETNLHTMCRLVDRMPSAAESMARSMRALLAKAEAEADGGQDGAPHSIFGMADKRHQPWLQLPFDSAAHMVAYSRQLLSFRAHDLRPLRARAPLPQPVLLVTGDCDSTTSCERARDVCATLCRPRWVEVRHGSHYFLDQNSEVLAALLATFFHAGADGELPPHPRLRVHRDESPAVADILACGEL